MLDGLGFLANLLEWALSSYLDAFEALEHDLEEIDAKAMSGEASVSDEVLAGLVEMRREVGRLRRALVSHREVVLALTRPELEAIASSDSAERFTSLRDRLEEAVQASRDARESIVGSFDVLLASTGQRTNEIMKVLTLASVLLLPGALIAGVMGMNFEVGIFETRCVLLGGPGDHRDGRCRDARSCKGARVDLTEYRVEPPAEGRPPEPPVRVRALAEVDPRLGRGHRRGGPRADVRVPRDGRDHMGARRRVLRDCAQSGGRVRSSVAESAVAVRRRSSSSSHSPRSRCSGSS